MSFLRMMGSFLPLAALTLVSVSATAAEPLPIDSFITKDAVVEHGLFNIILKNGHYYAEIPRRVLGRDLLTNITILRGAARKQRTSEMTMGFGGDAVFDKVIRLQKEKDNILVLEPDNRYVDSTNIAGRYLASIPVPVNQSLPVIAASDSSWVVDLTERMMSDDKYFSLAGAASTLHLGAPETQYTKIEKVESFPGNVNFISRRSYLLEDTVKDEDNHSQWEVCASWLLLPEKPMQPRIADSRVGYFVHGLIGLSEQKDRSNTALLAARWRLEPKAEDLEKYRRGELVEPARPIVYYISRTVPDYLRPYFIKAVDNWQKVFEKAGFKNAIHAELAPDDSTFSEGDLRYSIISYKASPIPNAYGPHVVDPRSGEILNTHIAIYHSVLDLIQRWYFVMCSPSDKRAIPYPLPKDIMGKLAETVLTHEVGHTLGLRHNFIGSLLYPVDSLRSASFVRTHGLGASIMDYQRFNYIPQPQDKMPEDLLFPHTGPYDDFAIEWGYRYFPGKTVEKTTQDLRQWVTEMRAKNPASMYIEETKLGDPRVQAEDSGNDDIKADTYGMKNLQYVMDHLEQWTDTPDKDYYPLRRRFLSVINQYDNYIGHVMKYIGGVYNDYPDYGEKGRYINTPVPRHIQDSALAFLKENLFKEPKWLWREKLMEKTGVDWDNYAVATADRHIGILLYKYSGLIDNRNSNITATELLDFIFDNLYTAYPAGTKLSYYVRALQRKFVTTLTINAENDYNLGIGMSEKFKQMLENVKAYAEQGAAKAPDALTRDHFLGIVRFVTFWQTGSNKDLK